jgi:hypothetical protein
LEMRIWELDGRNWEVIVSWSIWTVDEIGLNLFVDVDAEIGVWDSFARLMR